MHGYGISEVYIQSFVATYALKNETAYLAQNILTVMAKYLSGRHKSQLHRDTAEHILRVYQNIMHVTAG